MLLDSMTPKEIIDEMGKAYKETITPAANRICERLKKRVKKVFTKLGEFSIPSRGTKYLYAVQAKEEGKSRYIIDLDYLIAILKHDNTGMKYVVKSGLRSKWISGDTESADYVSKYEWHFFERLRERLGLDIVENNIEDIARYYFRKESGMTHQSILLKDNEDGSISFMEVGRLGIAFGDFRQIGDIVENHYKTFVREDMLYSDQKIYEEEVPKELMKMANEAWSEIRNGTGDRTISSMYLDYRNRG